MVQVWTRANAKIDYDALAKVVYAWHVQAFHLIGFLETVDLINSMDGLRAVTKQFVFHTKGWPKAKDDRSANTKESRHERIVQ